MATVTYSCDDHEFVPGEAQTTTYPMVEVIARFGGHSHHVWCLLDTGADDTMFDLGAASGLHINPLELPEVDAYFAGGGSGRYGLKHNVELELACMAGSKRVPVDVLFGEVLTPILGRSAMLHAGWNIDIGFNSVLWQHT